MHLSSFSCNLLFVQDRINSIYVFKTFRVEDQSSEIAD